MESIIAPPLAGLGSYTDAAKVGISVDATVERLRRYVYLKSQSLFIMAAHFNALPEWEMKGALSLHMWQEAEHSTWLRVRITEMRMPPHHLDRVPDPALAAFVGELSKAANTAELLVGFYEILKPAMVDALGLHLAETHVIADHPTRRLLRFVLSEEEEQLVWGHEALAALAKTEAGKSAEMDGWRAHLGAYLAAAGGISGVGSRPEENTLPAPRAKSERSSSRVPRRDGRFSHVWKSRGVVPGMDRSAHERIWWMMFVRLNEMHVSELVASVLADWRGQPWAFYHDLARHLWDETRHCMLGEVAFVSQGVDFTQLPTHVGFAEYPNTQLAPADRYSFLWGIEQGLMGKSGKQAEVALAQEGGDERAEVFQDYDWADEVLHAQIGRRWLEPHYGGREQMNEAYARVRPEYDAMKERDLANEGRDWWPAFYGRFLAHKDPEACGGAQG